MSQATPGLGLAKYRNDPVGYARDVLGVELTQVQGEILLATLQPPYRVLVESGHNVGKTFLAAVAVNWWYDTRDPSAAITTAPTERDVVDLLWTEVRLLRSRAKVKLPDTFIGPSAPEMRDHEEHYAKGYTARKGESFQGRHRPCMLFVFDEAEGIEGTYWRTANTMFQPDGTHAFLAILNPTTTTSQSYQEEQATLPDGSPKWRLFRVSSLDHPNVTAGVVGKPAPIPNAVTLEQVQGWLADWFEPVEAADVDPDVDVEFPAGGGKWWRPDPEGEARVLGRRPSAGTFGVWSERLWERACTTALTHRIDVLPEIGADVARFGNDRSEFHVRCDCCSLHHEDHGGWDNVKVADRLMELATHWAAWMTGLRMPQAAPIDPKTIPIKVDDTGVGGGVTDILTSNGFNVVPVNAGAAAVNADKYPRIRDELWFTTRDRAKAGQLDLTRLGKKRLAKLQTQALAPTWLPTPDRRRQVEPKEKTKERIGRSPDGMDSLNLAYFETAAGDVAKWVGDADTPNWRDRNKR